MTDPRDEFYQPWLREPPAGTPAPTKRRYEPAPNDGGIARDEAVPLGVDLSGYVIDETPPPAVKDRVAPAAQAAGASAARLASAARTGAMHFADWTIRLGARADVPTRIARLEIPRRLGAVSRRLGTAIAIAARATAASSARAGRSTAKALAEAGNRAATAISNGAANGVRSGGQRLAALRQAKTASASPPASGLDRLLESEPKLPAAPAPAPDSLPLFTAPTPVAAQAAASPGIASSPPPVPVSADERPARQDGPPKTSFGGGASGFAGTAEALPRWIPWGAGALLLLALAFWLGSRWGGSSMDRAAMETVVRETILANPEIVPQALERHQANQMAAAIEAVRPVLEKPFSGAWAGNAKGDVTVTLFTDYGCVFCRASIADIDRLLREDKGVKLVYRELPIIAPQSKDAALAALAAARQGKYDAFHHAMFAAPGLDRAAIDAASTRAGVILDGRSDAGVDTRLFEREIDNNLALAQQLGVSATPTWIIGSRMLQGAVGFDELRKAVAEARKAG